MCIVRYDTHESVPTQQRERMVVDLVESVPTKRERMVVNPVDQCQKLYLQLYELLMMGVNARNM